MSATGGNQGAPSGAEFIEVDVHAGGHHRPAERTDISAGVALAINADRQVLGGDVCELLGWSLRESTGAGPTTLRLHDGNSAAGELLATIAIVTGGASTVYEFDHGVRVTTGRIFVHVVNGSVEGVIYWR